MENMKKYRQLRRNFKNIDNEERRIIVTLAVLEALGRLTTSLSNMSVKLELT